MDQKMTRRQALKAGAALAAAAPLAALPFPAGIEAAPVAADTTKTDLTDDDRAWVAKRLTRNAFGRQVIGAEDLTRHWTRRPTPLHVTPESDRFFPVFEFLRRSDRQQRAWEASSTVKSRTEWVWGMPEPLRAAFLAFADDVAQASESDIGNAMSDALYTHMNAALGVTVYEIEDDDWEYQEPSDADKLRAWRQPTTIGAVLLALSEELEINPHQWLNAHDLALLRQAV